MLKALLLYKDLAFFFVCLFVCLFSFVLFCFFFCFVCFVCFFCFVLFFFFLIFMNKLREKYTLSSQYILQVIRQTEHTVKILVQYYTSRDSQSYLQFATGNESNTGKPIVTYGSWVHHCCDFIYAFRVISSMLLFI